MTLSVYARTFSMYYGISDDDVDAARLLLLLSYCASILSLCPSASASTPQPRNYKNIRSYLSIGIVIVIVVIIILLLFRELLLLASPDEKWT